MTTLPKPVHAIDPQFVDAVRGMTGDSAPTSSLPDNMVDLFDAQMISRHLDLAARVLRGRGTGFYTIGSSGHEGNVAVADCTRPTDPAFLHYRSGGFFVRRAHQHGGVDPIRDVLLGMVAARDEPIAGGRHKVFGSAPLNIPPQTSTIASHLPKAVGMAFFMALARRSTGLKTAYPDDAIVVCSFGDASANHSTAAGAINATCRIAHQRVPMPILFVCEDNGLGISVRTPPGWIEAAYGSRPGLHYVQADGCDLAAAHEAATNAVAIVREQRRPVFLHLQTERLMGHAGSDVELVYRNRAGIDRSEKRDPLIATARALVDAGVRTPEQIVDRYEQIRQQVAEHANQAEQHPHLESAADIMSPLAPRDDSAIATAVRTNAPAAERAKFWQDRLPETEGPLTLSSHINRTLGDLLVAAPELLIFGEDVARKGGVYGVTRNLEARAGRARVFDTILDEQTVLGMAIGAAQLGFVPVPEIQYLAYLHNAEDQLRGEAATLQFFSQNQFRNPMVVRIAAYAYQKGFGGHFHNDNSIAVLRDIPGLIIASPSNGVDAAAMLRTCVAAAKTCGSVSAFLEPIALYNVRDLNDEGDGLYQADYDANAEHVPIGSGRVHGDGTDLLIVSFANGVRMSRRVAHRLRQDRGINSRVLDLRWLAPLPIADLLSQADATGRVLIVDETRRTGGVSESLIAELVDGGFSGQIRRVTAADSLIPLGDAANHVLVSEADIEAAALRLGEAR